MTRKQMITAVESIKTQLAGLDSLGPEEVEDLIGTLDSLETALKVRPVCMECGCNSDKDEFGCLICGTLTDLRIVSGDLFCSTHVPTHESY